MRTRISQLLQTPTIVELNLWSPDTPGDNVNTLAWANESEQNECPNVMACICVKLEYLRSW